MLYADTDTALTTGLVRVDATGHIEWMKPISQPHFTAARGSLIRTLDGNYRVNIYRAMMEGGISSGVRNGMAVLDAAGTLLNYVEPCTTCEEMGRRATIQLPDGSFLTAHSGTIGASGDYAPLLVHSDAAGNLLSELWLESDCNYLTELDTIANDYVFGAQCIEDDNQVGGVVTRVDAAGTVLWERPLADEDYNSVPLHVQTMQNGNVVISWAADTVINGAEDAYPFPKYVACLDGATGEELWRVFFNEPFLKAIHGMRIAQNGDIIGVGMAYLNTSLSEWRAGCSAFHQRVPCFGSGYITTLGTTDQLMWPITICWMCKKPPMGV